MLLVLLLIALHYECTNNCIVADYVVTDYDKQQAALRLIDEILSENGKRLADFQTLPKIDNSDVVDVGNRLIIQELSYDKECLAIQSAQMRSNLNADQLIIFEKVKDAVDKGCGGFFFVHGYGVLGKHFCGML